MDVDNWLCDLCLGEYAAAFRENSVSWDLLPSLTADDLRDLGVAAVGHRRRLLNAIAALSEGTQSVDTVGPAEPMPAQTAERRQLSVMFCDIVGSTSLSTRLDPEDLSAVVRGYQASVRATIARFGGFIARYVGDGVLIYFGWPEAQETDAESAVRAALAVIAAVNECPFHGEHLSIRIGIATGLVVVGSPIGEGDARQQTAIGETPNLAARLQSVADSNSVIVDASTRGRTGDLFDCRALGPLQLKGFAEPVQAWVVVDEAAIDSRFSALRPGGLTPLVGRDEDVTLLLRRWQQAKAGEGRVVLIVGEAGIGKSRLIAELEAATAGGPHVKLRYGCSPHHRDSALYPVIAHWEHEAGFARGDSGANKFCKLAARLHTTGATPTDIALIAELLGLPLGEGYAPVELSPQRRKQRMLNALMSPLMALACRQPVLVLFEDAHWADPSSLELLDGLIGTLAELPILLVISARPEFVAPWVGSAGVSLMTLSRLNQREASQLATHVTRGHTAQPGFLERIVAQGDGVPLFLEELTKTLLEGGTASESIVPPTLHSSLMARLDRMPSAKQVAQVAAVIGREFSLGLLTAAASMSEGQVTEGLDRLVQSGLILHRGSPPDIVYAFKHALVQEVAYDSLLRGRRSQIHAAIVGVMESDSSIDALLTARLAHHCERAGLPRKAVTHLLRAGQQFANRSAMAEARAHLTRGVVLAAELRGAIDKSLCQAELLLALANVEMALHGFGSSEHAATFASAATLCSDLDTADPEQRQLVARVLWGEWTRKVHAGDMAASLDDAGALQALGEQHTDAILCAIARTSRGASLAALGRLDDAIASYAMAACQYERSGHQATGTIFGIDIEVVWYTLSSRAFACQGAVARATELAALGSARARGLEHTPSVAIALGSACTTFWILRDTRRLEDCAGELMRLASEQGFGFWLARAKAYSGWVRAVRGDTAQGRQLLTEARATLDAIGVTLYAPQYCFMLAQVLAWSGEAVLAFDLLQEALATAARTGEIYLDAEVHRVLGDLRRDDPAGAELELQQALEIARGQAAHLFALRAAVSLARLWIAQRRGGAAHELLAEMLGQFGGDSPELEEARELLG